MLKHHRIPRELNKFTRNTHKKSIFFIIFKRGHNQKLACFDYWTTLFNISYLIFFWFVLDVFLDCCGSKMLTNFVLLWCSKNNQIENSLPTEGF